MDYATRIFSDQAIYFTAEMVRRRDTRHQYSPKESKKNEFVTPAGKLGAEELSRGLTLDGMPSAPRLLAFLIAFSLLVFTFCCLRYGCPRKGVGVAIDSDPLHLRHGFSRKKRMEGATSRKEAAHSAYIPVLPPLPSSVKDMAVPRSTSRVYDSELGRELHLQPRHKNFSA
jgi:hypothetical protein